jgi:hypothetical protein
MVFSPALIATDTALADRVDSTPQQQAKTQRVTQSHERGDGDTSANVHDRRRQQRAGTRVVRTFAQARHRKQATTQARQGAATAAATAARSKLLFQRSEVASIRGPLAAEHAPDASITRRMHLRKES